MKQATMFFAIITLLVLGGIFTFILQGEKEVAPGKHDGLAQCLKDKGAVFYGAFWCSHCKAQKALFGSSFKLLSYVECSTPDGRAQNQACIDKKIEGYPTWEFSDGERMSGEVSLLKLAEKTGCVLSE